MTNFSILEKAYMDNLSPQPRVKSSLRRRALFVAFFFTVLPIALLASIVTFVSIDISNNQALKNSKITQTLGEIYLPSSISPSISGQVLGIDARSEIIRQYLNRFNSPLEPYAGYLVRMSDKYDLDFRLTTAIAQQESNLCKAIPPNSHNCWGWGIHSRGTLKFASYEEAIETVTKGIKVSYIDEGYTTPEEIMQKYTPLSNGSWAEGVIKFMAQMR